MIIGDASCDAARTSSRDRGALLELALNATKTGFFTWDVAEDRGDPDDRFAALFGVPPGGRLDLKTALATMIHPADRERYAASVARAADPSGDGEFDQEIRLSLANDVERWVAIRGRVQFEGNPRRAVRMIGTGTEITARKRAELALRESEVRQGFLLRLSDALRAESSAGTITNRALRMIFEQVGLDRCYVGIYRLAEDIADFPHQVHDNRLSPMPAQVRLSDFPEALKVAFDRTLVIDDVMEMEGLSDSDRASFEGLDLRAVIAATLRKGENNPLWAIVVGCTCPRVWTQGEISLVEEAAERTWAAVERARAEAELRESEARFRLMAELRESEARQAFMLELSDALRPLDTPVGIALEAAARLGKWLGLNRVFYGEIADTKMTVECDYTDGVKSLVGTHDMTAFGDFLLNYRADALIVSENTQADTRYGEDARAGLLDREVVAFCDIGLFETDDWVSLMCAQSARPRQWTAVDRGIVREVGGRVKLAIDRARAEAALRESEARLRTALDIAALGTFQWWPETGQVELDARARAIFGLPPDGRLTDGEVFGAMAPEDLPRVHEASLDSVAKGGRLEINYDIVLPDGSRRSIESIGEPTESAGGRTTRMFGTFLDVTERYNKERQLRESETRFRQFSDASTNVLWIRDAETLGMTFASPAFDMIYGIPGPEHGGASNLQSWARLIEPESRKAVLANFRRVRAGERVDHEFRIRRATDGALRWMHDTAFPLRDASGVVRWVAGLGADITDAREATDRKGVLVAELQHRTRNLIAVVRSLADRTLSNATSLNDFGKRFRPRLAALSRVQGLLSHLATGERVTFKELLCAELAAHGATDGLTSKVTLAGPTDVPLRSATVQTFALALHELATNAVKYGTFASVDGHLAVRWHVEPALGGEPPRLHVEWRESGVAMPHVDAPARGGGYGRELIERALPYQLKAKTTYELGVDGVRCTISVPIAGGGG